MPLWIPASQERGEGGAQRIRLPEVPAAPGGCADSLRVAVPPPVQPTAPVTPLGPGNEEAGKATMTRRTPRHPGPIFPTPLYPAPRRAHISNHQPPATHPHHPPATHLFP